jgi:hypothetical protein
MSAHDQILGFGGTEAHKGVSAGGHHMEDHAGHVELVCLVNLRSWARVDHRLHDQRRPRGSAPRIGQSRAPCTYQEIKRGQATDGLVQSAFQFCDCSAGRTAPRVDRLDATNDSQEAQPLGEQVGANDRQRNNS